MSSADRAPGEGNGKDDACCEDGETCVNVFKATLTRILFLSHAMLVLQRTVQMKSVMYWLFAIPYGALVIEMIVVLLLRRGKDWNW